MTTFLAFAESTLIQTAGINLADCIAQLEEIGNFKVMAKHHEDAEDQDWHRVDIAVGELDLPAAEINADTDYSHVETRDISLWIEQN